MCAFLRFEDKSENGMCAAVLHFRVSALDDFSQAAFSYCLLKKNSWHFKRDDFQDYFGTDFYILEFITSNGFLLFSQIIQDCS